MVTFFELSYDIFCQIKQLIVDESHLLANGNPRKTKNRYNAFNLCNKVRNK